MLTPPRPFPPDSPFLLILLPPHHPSAEHPQKPAVSQALRKGPEAQAECDPVALGKRTF